MSLKSELARKNLERSVLKPLGVRKEDALQLALSGLNINVASVAIGLEALEMLLVEKGILKDDELLNKLREVARSKAQNPLLGSSDD